MKKMILGWAACWAVSMVAAQAIAHPGGLNREGCHHNRKTGDYHCHRATSGTDSVPVQRLRPGPGRVVPASPGRPFANCAEARAAGAAPVRYGEPGYGLHLDRDRDGVGCEPYRGR